MNENAGPHPYPGATYRLQFNKAFRFADAQRIVPYLAALGVSHLYASPLLMARPGSSHGYDIVDHNRLNPEFGSEAEFDQLVTELHRHGMGLILDFVPNHMGVGVDNPWWMDVLEWGRASSYAAFFDIDWQAPEASLAGKLLLPVLGDHYGAVLERGELQLSFDAGRGTFAAGYFEHTFPLAPQDYPALLRAAAELDTTAAIHLERHALEFGNALRARRLTERQARVQSCKQRLAEYASQHARVTGALALLLQRLNGKVGHPASFDALDRLLDRQRYRLAFWEVAMHEINYRRFFDINDLAGLRMERPALFQASHRLIARLITENKVQGLRLDHIDGLRDPKAYLVRLQKLNPGRELYVLVEKILASHEGLRRDWPVNGTTGYEFLNLVNGLFVDPAGEQGLNRCYRDFIGRDLDYEALVIASKRLIMRDALASELNVLANQFNRLAKQNRHTRDYFLAGFREALTEVVARFPVYRTYVTVRRTSAEDRRDLDWAVGQARKATHALDKSIFDFIYAVLSLDLLRQNPRGYRRRDALDAALKFQQYTGPVMAKALEDTAFYGYVRLTALNEVGGEPSRFGASPAAFHEANRRRLRDWPTTMLATATHDHKRGEDMRARLDVLSEIPAEWTRRVRRWARFNRRKQHEVNGRSAPDRNDEYLFYQTLVGAWPYGLGAPDFAGLDTFRQRLENYMRKAVREAKRHSSWTAPQADYEAALAQFVQRSLALEVNRPFLEDISAFVARIAPTGAVNSLAQTLLKLTSPGVPDIYQGNEYWDLSLVDPDNRRPVNYAAREVSLQAHAWDALLEDWHDGRLKQWLIHRTLKLRAQYPELFARGTYQALETAGIHGERLIAFVRRLDGTAVVVVAPRLVWPLVDDSKPQLIASHWEDTVLKLPDVPAEHSLRDVLTGHTRHCHADGSVRVSELLAGLPVALLLVCESAQ